MKRSWRRLASTMLSPPSWTDRPRPCRASSRRPSSITRGTSDDDLDAQVAYRRLFTRSWSAHDDAIMLGEALDTRGGASEITYGFLQRYGSNRVIETPISENALTGMALGAAVAGLRVMAEIYSADFLVCAGSEVVNDIAKWRYQHQWDKPIRLVLRMPCGSSGKWAGPGAYAVDRGDLQQRPRPAHCLAEQRRGCAPRADRSASKSAIR